MGRKYKTKNLVNNRARKRAARLKDKRKAERITEKTHHKGIGGASGKPKRQR